MRDHDDLPYIVIERRSAGLGPFVWGAMLGAGAALLLAPRSGVQTQEEIRRGVNRARTAAEDRIDAARDSVSRTRDRLEEELGSVRDRFSAVRERVESGAEHARETLENGRRVARNARDEIERRLSDTESEEPRVVSPGPTLGTTFGTAANTLDAAGDRPVTPEIGGIDGGYDVGPADIGEDRVEGRSDLA